VTRHPTRPDRGAWLWLALSASLAAGAAVLWFAPREALDWQPARALGQPWRAWSAAFVHWTPWHLAANLFGCAVVAAFGVAAQVPARATAAWLAAWPVLHMALGMEPQLASYGGLSGLLHAGVAIAAWHLMGHDTGARRAIGWAVMAGLVVKVLLEQPWAAPTRTVAGWDFPLAPLAHATGALAGLACGALADALARWRR
jgi:rhomboid family GlyGly-CTERM serine protease